jgi:hypothetical protein
MGSVQLSMYFLSGCTDFFATKRGKRWESLKVGKWKELKGGRFEGGTDFWPRKGTKRHENGKV